MGSRRCEVSGGALGFRARLRGDASEIASTSNFWSWLIADDRNDLYRLSAFDPGQTFGKPLLREERGLCEPRLWDTETVETVW